MTTKKFVSKILALPITMTILFSLFAIPTIIKLNSNYYHYVLITLVLPLTPCLALFFFKGLIKRAIFLEIGLTLCLITPLLPGVYVTVRMVQAYGGISEWWITILVSILGGIWYSITIYLNERKKFQTYFWFIKFGLSSNKLDIQNKKYDISIHVPSGDSQQEKSLKSCVQTMLFPFLPFISRLLSRNLGETQGMSIMLVLMFIILMVYLVFPVRFLTEVFEINKIEKTYFTDLFIP